MHGLGLRVRLGLGLGAVGCGRGRSTNRMVGTFGLSRCIFVLKAFLERSGSAMLLGGKSMELIRRTSLRFRLMMCWHSFRKY